VSYEYSAGDLTGLTNTMALLEILHHPDPRLRNRARPVTTFDDALHTLIEDMLETMYAAPGIGLAATQVNVHQRVLVLDISPDRNAPMHIINPTIVASEGEFEMEEGCLSVPGVFEIVARSEQVQVRAFDRENTAIELEANGLLAVCIQHEIDHLDGKLFVDYLSQLKQNRIRKKLEKEQRLAI
jgi:peptide deformylase